MLDAQDDAGIGATHLSKTHYVIDLDIGVGAHIAQHRQTAGAIGQRIGQTGAHRLLLAFGLIPKRRHVGGGSGGHGAGGAGREKRVRIALLNGAARKHDRRLTLGHHGANGIVIHGDNVRRLKGLNTCMGSGKGIDDFGGTSCQDLDIGIGGKRSLDTIENNLRFLVSAHNVYTNANVTHIHTPYTKMADSLSRPLWFHLERHRIQSIPLLGNDNLAVLVETAAGAHVVRKLDSAATGASGLSRSRNLHVGGTTGVSADTTLLLFRYGHSDLPYELSSVAITRK